MIDPVLDTTLIDPTGIGLTPAVVVAFVLSVATLLSIVGNRRGLASGAAGIGRVLVLPILVATLLYFTLLPPTTAPAPTRFELLTEGADQAAIRSHWPRFALPEAWSLSERDPEIVRVVDLAAALRMQPTAVAIGIHGHGLGPRDLADRLGTLDLAIAEMAAELDRAASGVRCLLSCPRHGCGNPPIEGSKRAHVEMAKKQIAQFGSARDSPQ